MGETNKNIVEVSLALREDNKVEIKSNLQAIQTARFLADIASHILSDYEKNGEQDTAKQE